MISVTAVRRKLNIRCDASAVERERERDQFLVVHSFALDKEFRAWARSKRVLRAERETGENERERERETRENKRERDLGPYAAK